MWLLRYVKDSKIRSWHIYFSGIGLDKRIDIIVYSWRSFWWKCSRLLAAGSWGAVNYWAQISEDAREFCGFWWCFTCDTHSLWCLLTGESVVDPIVLDLNFKVGLWSEFLTYGDMIYIYMITVLWCIHWCGKLSSKILSWGKI